MTLYRCSVHGLQPAGGQWSFRQYYTSGGSVAAVEADWLAQIDSWWLNGSHGLETLFPAGTTVETTKTAGIAVVSIGGIDKLREVSINFDNPALVGTATGDPMAEQCAILVSLRTATGGKEGRGRNHLPAPDETLAVGGELTLVTAQRATAAFLALKAGMAAAGHTQVLATEVKPKTGTAVGTTKPVTEIETDRIVRTQRVRNKGRRAIYA
jgi:hypothetical protein